MKIFTEWMKDRIQLEFQNQKQDIYSAREMLKNAMANMQSNPWKWLGETLPLAAQKVQGNEQAMRIVSDIQNLYLRFVSEIKHKNLVAYGRNGSISSPRAPTQDEYGFKEYQELYHNYYRLMIDVWRGLDDIMSQR